MNSELLFLATMGRALAGVLAARAKHALRPAGEAGEPPAAMVPRREIPRFAGLHRDRS